MKGTEGPTQTERWLAMNDEERTAQMLQDLIKVGRPGWPSLIEELFVKILRDVPWQTVQAWTRLDENDCRIAVGLATLLRRGH